MQIRSAKDLDVNRRTYALTMEVFQISKGFPSEERFALIDHVRLSEQSAVIGRMLEAMLRNPTSL